MRCTLRIFNHFIRLMKLKWSELKNWFLRNCSQFGLGLETFDRATYGTGRREESLVHNRRATGRRWGSVGQPDWHWRRYNSVRASPGNSITFRDWSRLTKCYGPRNLCQQFSWVLSEVFLIDPSIETSITSLRRQEPPRSPQSIDSSMHPFHEGNQKCMLFCILSRIQRLWRGSVFIWRLLVTPLIPVALFLQN